MCGFQNFHVFWVWALVGRKWSSRSGRLILRKKPTYLKMLKFDGTGFGSPPSVRRRMEGWRIAWIPLLYQLLIYFFIICSLDPSDCVV